MQQHLQQQVVVHNHGKVAARAKARVSAKATAKALALADREVPVQGGYVSRGRPAIQDGRVDEEDGSPNRRRRVD